MSCKRIHAVVFNLAIPICDIALESAEEVKKSCPGLAWVEESGSSHGNSICEPPQRPHSLCSPKVSRQGLHVGPGKEVSS